MSPGPGPAGSGPRLGVFGATATAALLARGLITPFSAFAVYLLEHLLDDTCVTEFLILMPEPQRRACVLDAVVGLVLNVFLEQVPGQEAKAELSLPRADVE